MPNRVIENEDLYETWKNESKGTVVIKRVGRTGELVDEIVTGGKTIHLTPSERRLNQESFAEEEYDCFKNGTLSPVKLIETAEDAAQFIGNPNHLGESEMSEFFKDRRAVKALEERVAQISNPIALEKLVEVAIAEDASVRQLEIVKARLEEVAPSLYQEVQTVAGASTK